MKTKDSMRLFSYYKYLYVEVDILKKIKFKSFREVLKSPWSRMFWVERCSEGYKFGDPQSLMKNNSCLEHLTFDIGNNRCLANMGVNGTIKYLTIYRYTYRANESQSRGWPGVWLHKDFSCFGSYYFKLKIGDDIYDLSKVDWPSKTGFLDNIFPITEMRGEKVRVTLLTYAPITKDGSKRLSGIVYGAFIENLSHEKLKGSVILPELFTDTKRLDAEKDWITYRGDDFEMSLLDSPEDRFEVDMELCAGEAMWVPVGIYAPGEPFVQSVNEKGTLKWLEETWGFFRDMIGELIIEDNPFLSEFLVRNILTCFECIGMDPDEFIAGSNWGTYPTHYAIWIKDMYYSCLPFATLEPNLFKKVVLWFERYGTRQHGHILKGGVSHSLSISLASMIMAGMYYQATADQEFFHRNLHLKKAYEQVVDEMMANRRDEKVYLFTSEYLSDGATYGDWHTGINVCAWYALKSLSLLMKDVYSENAKAEFYQEIAAKVKSDIEQRCKLNGPFGTQYNEGFFCDGIEPVFMSDGEESDTTLMPFYKYCSKDDETYHNYMRFSMSEYNIAFNPVTRCIKWNINPHMYPQGIEATAPGYLKGIATITSREEMEDPQGYMTILRNITDADGSLWWWPYQGEFVYGKPLRGPKALGKSGWASGVFTALFINRFLGLSYNALTKTLNFSPLAIDKYYWENAKFGNHRFTITYERCLRKVAVTVNNLNECKVSLKYQIPMENAFEGFVTVNGKENIAYEKVTNESGKTYIISDVVLLPNQSTTIVIGY